MIKGKVGFVLTLIGLGGIAEAYPSIRQMIISLALICVGTILFYRGICKGEKNSDSSRASSDNVLDRLRYLP